MIRNALISCHDKTKLKYFVSELVKLNPDIRIYCSSGTFAELSKASPENLAEISEYTGMKEMPSGLVKTLHPKIHAGILADLGKNEQAAYLESINGVAFDLIVVNLYPFLESSKNRDIERARANIDIGGVSLIESAAKNFPRVFVLVSPVQYEKFLESQRNSEDGLGARLRLAQAAFDYLLEYFGHISRYFGDINIEKLEEEYNGRLP